MAHREMGHFDAADLPYLISGDVAIAVPVKHLEGLT